MDESIRMLESMVAFIQVCDETTDEILIMGLCQLNIPRCSLFHEFQSSEQGTQSARVVTWSIWKVSSAPGAGSAVPDGIAVATEK